MIKMLGRFPLLNLPSFGGDLKGFVGHQFPPTSEADDPGGLERGISEVQVLINTEPRKIILGFPNCIYNL